MKEYIDHLKELKNKLDRQLLSVLVGSGMSKNFDAQFLTWPELLHDMILDMYEDRIKNDFEIVRASRKKSDYKKFLKDRVDLIIKETGYLEIASKYQAEKGSGEALAVYVEQRVPYVEQSSGKQFLVLGAKRTEIPESRFSLHKKLVSLPWNNIYTTNYDNLIEHCVDRNIASAIDDRIEKLNQEIDDNEKEVRDIEKKIESLAAEIEKEQPKVLEAFFEEEKLVKAITAPVPKELQDKVLALNNAKYKNDALRRSSGEKSRKVVELSNLKDELQLEVTHSSQLAFKHRRNIIKLHGTLRGIHGSDYGFDNDTKAQYILTKEDFDDYPKKHEAFTQFMRISLLAESFCLVGFSGSDPNFRGWLSWVREVIERKSKTSEHEKKIYLVEPSDIDADEERKLFFENHRIARIPLLNKDCIDFLESETKTKITNRKSKSEILEVFLSYLGGGHRFDKVNVAMEKLKQEDYKGLWNSWNYGAIYQEGFDPASFYKNIPEGLGEKPRNINLKYDVERRNSILDVAALHLRSITDKEAQRKLLSIVLASHRGVFVPLTSVITNFKDLVQSSKSFPDIHSAYKLLEIKNGVWTNSIKEREFNSASFSDDGMKEELKYSGMLRLAFNFEFSKLRKALDKWTPAGHWIMKKAGLLALINLDKAKELLRGSPYQEYQQELFRLKLLTYFEQSGDWFIDVRVRSEYLKRLEAEGFQKFGENFDFIFEQFKKRPSKVTPLGQGKFSIGRSFSFGQKKAFTSLQFFGLLVERGLPLSLPRTHYYNAEAVYPIARKALAYAPFPVLYFMFQYSDESVLRRLAQDCAYSDEFNDVIGEISRRLSAALADKSTPEGYKRSISKFYAELLVGLPPSVWEKTFLVLWKDRKKSGELFSDDVRVSTDYFIKNGLKFISDVAIVRLVIEECLNQAQKGETSRATEHLYDLAHNPLLKKSGKQIWNKTLDKAVQKIITNIPTLDLSLLLLLGNIDELLNVKIKRQIRQQLAKADFSKVKSERVWNLVVFYSGDDKALHKTIKPHILKSKDLWRTGISAKSASSDTVSFISLYKISRSNSRKTGLEWSDKELVAISEKLEERLGEIEGLRRKDSMSPNYESILAEMNGFLKSNGKKLSSLKKTYQGVFERSVKLLHKERGFVELSEGLRSKNQSEVVIALDEIAKLLYREGELEQSLELIKLLFVKLTMKAKPGLGASLHYLSGWFYHFRDKPILMRFQGDLMEVIKYYHTNKLPEKLDLPFVQEKLLLIAFVLDSWKVKDDLVTKYLDLHKTSKFNNIRNFVFE